MLNSNFKFRKKNLDKKFSNINNITHNKNVNYLSIYTFIKTTQKKNYKIIVMWFEHFDALKQSTKNNKYLLINTFINKIAIIIIENYKKFFNKLCKKFMFRKKFRVRFFEKFKNKAKCFDVKKANKLFRCRD